MAMKISMIVITSVLTILILCVNEAPARLTSSLGLSVSESYNDNIYLRDTNKEDDFITKVSPSFSLNFKNGRHDASLDYSYEWQEYAQNPKASDGFNNGSAKISSIIIERLLTVNVSDNYGKTATDTRRATSEGEVLVNTVDKNTFIFNPVLHRNISPVTTLRLGYEFKATDYSNKYSSNTGSRNSEDVKYNNVYVELERRLSKRLTVSGKYGRDDKATDGDITEDFISRNASISSSLQLTPDTSFDATIGRTWYDYERRSSNEANFWNVVMKTRVMTTGTATLNYSRNSRDSVELGTYLSETTGLKLSFGKRFKIAFGASIRKDEYLTSSREDDIMSADGSLNWQMTKKISLFLNGNLSNRKYTAPAEEVDQWSSTLGGNYKLGRHIAVRANFKHTDRDSTTQLNSYDNNVVMVSVLATY